MKNPIFNSPVSKLTGNPTLGGAAGTVAEKVVTAKLSKGKKPTLAQKAVGKLAGALFGGFITW